MKVRELYLSGIGVQEVDNGAFHGLETNLEILCLDGNQLDSVTVGAFSNLQSLKLLNLSSNAIEQLSQGVFVGLSNLSVLDVGNNVIWSIADGTFSGLTNLKELRLEVCDSTNLIENLHCSHIILFLLVYE